MKEIMCYRCQKLYIPTSNRQRFCGSENKKIGCSYLRKLERNIIYREEHPDYFKTETWRNYYKKYMERYNRIVRLTGKKPIFIEADF